MTQAMLALMEALKGAKILSDQHLMIWTSLPIPTRGSVVQGWLLQLADKQDGTLTRFYLSGIPVEDAKHKVILVKGLFGVIDSDTAAQQVARAVDLGLIEASDGEVEKFESTEVPQ